jgi:hypothetical protein
MTLTISKIYKKIFVIIRAIFIVAIVFYVFSYLNPDINLKEPLNILSENDIKNMSNPESGFCKDSQGKSFSLNEKCKSLTEANCNKTSCCVFVNNDKCLAGSSDGPTYELKDENGIFIPIDTYYYMNKCHGKGCPK